MTMYVCMMCSSARGLGGFCYTNEINWFGDCDVAPEECPQCGAGLGVVRVDPSEPVAISTLCDIVRQQHGALATLREERARLAEVEAERDAARAEIEELRLTLAAEQGRPEGAPSEGWRWCDGVWSKDFPHGHHVRIMLAAGAGGSIMHVHHATEPHRRIAADSARAAMIAADKATT